MTNYHFKKKPVANTVYKLWLGQTSLGKSAGFSKAGFYQQKSVPRHATAHVQNVTQHLKKTTYIQFKAPKTDKKTQPDGIVKRTFKSAIIGILTSIIPKANPDFDSKIDLVYNWLLELDFETGIPEREIGLNKNGQVILKMPFKNNYGYWTDNNLMLNDFKKHFKTSEISNSEFEKYWNLFDQ